MMADRRPGLSGLAARELARMAADPKRRAALAQAGGLGRRALDGFDLLAPRFAGARALAGRWGGHPLFFLLRRLPVRSLGQLALLVDEKGEDAVSELMGEAITDPEVAAALDLDLVQARALSPRVRHHLRHGVAHATAGEWDDACPPLALALRTAVRERQVAERHEARVPVGTVELIVTEDRPSSRALSRPRALAGRAMARLRAPREPDIEADPRRQAVRLMADLLKLLESEGRSTSSAVFLRAVEQRIQGARDRRRPVRALATGERPPELPPG
jgi:hypothetical protein